MLICLKCEIEVEEGSSECPECHGPVEEVDESEFEYVDDDDDEDDEEEEEEEEGEESEDDDDADEEDGDPAPAPLASCADAEPPSDVDASEQAETPPASETTEETGQDEAAPQADAEAPAHDAADEAGPGPEAQADGETPPADTEEEAVEGGGEKHAEEGADGEEPATDGDKSDEEKTEETDGDKKEEKSGDDDKGGKKGAAPRRRTSRLEAKGKGDRKSSRRGAKSDDPPPPPKSLRLDQRRPPVLVALMLTLFLSFYYLGDFIIAIVVGELHLFQIGLFCWGLLSCLFLFGHGKWGRYMAVIMGGAGMLAGLFFMLRFNLENYAYMLALFVYTLAMLYTLTGTGLIFRTLGGLALTPVVMFLCLISLVMDFVPEYGVRNPTLQAYQEAKKLQGDAMNDPDKLYEAGAPVREAQEQNQKILDAFESVPWDSLGGGKYFVWSLLGYSRILDVYSLPATMERFLYELEGEHKIAKDEEVVLKGQENAALAHPGVAVGTLTVKNKDGETCLQNFDYSMQTGGLYGTTYIRRMSSTERIGDGDTVKASYHYYNLERHEHLAKADALNERVIDLITRGAGFSTLGQAVGEIYGKTTKNGFLLEKDDQGYQFLKNILVVEVLRLDRLTAGVANDVAEGRRAQPPDKAKIDAAVGRGPEIKDRFDRLFNLLGWMTEKLDDGEVGDRTARKMIGHIEFNMIFFNYAALLNAMNDGAEKPFEGDGKKLLEDALMQLFAGQCAVTQSEDPTKDEFRRQVGALLARVSSDFQKERWTGVLMLLARLTEKERLLREASGEGPKVEDVPEMEWLQQKNSSNITTYTATLKGNTKAGSDIDFEVVLIDRFDFLSGRKKPFLKGFRLNHDGFTGELFCHDGPASGLRLVFTEVNILDGEGKKKFGFNTGQARQGFYDVTIGNWLAPLHFQSEFDYLEFDDSHKKVHIELIVQEAKN